MAASPVEVTGVGPSGRVMPVSSSRGGMTVWISREK